MQINIIFAFGLASTTSNPTFNQYTHETKTNGHDITIFVYKQATTHATNWTFKRYTRPYVRMEWICIYGSANAYSYAYSYRNCVYHQVKSFTLLPWKRVKRSHLIIYWCPSITTTMKALQSIFRSPSMIMGAIGHHGDESTWIIYAIIVWPGHNIITCIYAIQMTS